MRQSLLSITAGLALASFAVPQAGHAGKGEAHTTIDAQNDGISVVFSAHSSRDLLSLTVRVAGPDGIVFDQRVEGPMLEWVPDKKLADGHYTWEARAVTAQPGAPKRELPVHPALATRDGRNESALKSGVSTADPGAIPIERRYAGEYKAVEIRSGMLRSTNGQLENFEEDDQRARSVLENMLGSLLNTVVRPAGAANLTASSNLPKVIFDRDATTGSDYEIEVGPSGMIFLDYGDGDIGSVAPFALIKDAPSASIWVWSTGDIGLGTSTAAEPLHIADTSPAIRFDDTDDAQVWSLQASGVGYAVADSTAGTVPFVIGPGATTGSLVVHSNGNIGLSGSLGIGTNSATAPLHVRRSNGSAKVLVEDTGSTSPQQMFKLTNNGFPAFNMEDTSQADMRWTFRLSGTQGSDERFTITKLGTGGAEMELRHNGNMIITGNYLTASSREVKEQIVPVDPATVLAKIEQLPIAEWSYLKAPSERHLGPMAEDWHAAFGLGHDHRTVSPTDMAGVALAAAKALKLENDTLKAKVAEIDAIKARLAELETRDSR